MAVKRFSQGYVAINEDMILNATNITLDITTETLEVYSFDNDGAGNAKIYEPNTYSWTVSFDGFITDDSTIPSKFSAETNITGTTNGYNILESIKSQSGTLPMVMKIDDSNYQTGDIIITSVSMSNGVGDKMNFSVQAQGSGDLALETS